jgi:type I restriction enzyme S subunit
MNETLEAMARAIFKDWFVDFGPARAKAEGRPPYLAPDLWTLFPDALDDEDKPVGWRTGQLQNLVELNPKEPLSKGSFAPYLEMAALPTSGSTPEPPIEREFASGIRFRNGDTLLAHITPCLENGKAAFVQVLPSEAVGWGSTEFIVLRPVPPVPKPYAYILARENNFRTHAIQSMTGTSGRQRARNEALAEYPVAIPNNADAIWRAFGSVIEAMFERIRVNGEESQTLAQLRDLLLPKLMSGEIRLREAERIVEQA